MTYTRKAENGFVRWFYDRSLKLWTITGHDPDGNQITETDYAPRKGADLDGAISDMMETLAGLSGEAGT